MVDDILLKFADKVTVYDHTVQTDTRMATLLLKPKLDDGSALTISVNAYARDDGSAKKEISVQEIDQGHKGRKYHRYHADTEDQVLRFDRADMYEHVQSRKDELITPLTSPAVAVAALEQKIASLHNEMANAKLEQDMGLNDQPVGADEIQQLADLIETATAES